MALRNFTLGILLSCGGMAFPGAANAQSGEPVVWSKSQDPDPHFDPRTMSSPPPPVTVDPVYARRLKAQHQREIADARAQETMRSADEVLRRAKQMTRNLCAVVRETAEEAGESWESWKGGCQD